MSNTQREGKCLCGAVSCVAEVPAVVEACHCNMCRQWGGGPFFVADCGTKVTFHGNEQIAVFASSDWAERGFCSVCGTHLFYRLKEQGIYYMPAGLFGNLGNVHFEREVFIDHKPDFYSFSNATEKLTGAALFAQMGVDA